MSLHVEWMEDPTVELVGAGTEVGANETDGDALVIGTPWDSSVVVIEGDLDGFLEAVRKAVQG